MLEFFSDNGIGKATGLFTWQHLFFTLIGLLSIWILLNLTSHFRGNDVKKIIKIIFWLVFVLEILKIIWNLAFREDISMSDWVPLYFCSIFIYASFMAGYCNGKIEILGKSFLFFGGIVAGIVFLLYPSTSIPKHSLLQVLTVHSLIFHMLQVYIGILIVKTNYYIPKKEDFKLYFIFLVILFVVVFIYNKIFDTNFMFLNETWEIPPLVLLESLVGTKLYPIFIGLLQIFGTYILSYYSYKTINIIKNKSKEV